MTAGTPPSSASAPTASPLIIGGAGAGLLLIEGLRVWLPSVLLVVGDAGSTSALTMGAFALGVLAVTVVAGDLAGRTNARWWWVVAGLIGLAALLGLRATEGGTPQAVLSSLVVLGAGTAIAALAAGAASAGAARTGLLGGLAASAGLHTALGTVDLVWRPGVIATLSGLTLALVAGRAMAAASRELAARAPVATELTDAPAAVWPWLVLAPVLTLIVLLVAPAGRVAVAVGATGALATVLALVIVALAPTGAILARARGGGPSLTALGAALVIVGAAGALDAAGTRAVASQAALALGLGLVVGGLPDTQPLPGGSRGGRAGGLALLGFGVLVFAYYAPYDLSLPYNNRGVPLAAATAVVVAAAASLRGPRRAAGIRTALPALSVLVAVTVALASPALLDLRSSAAPTTPTTPVIAGDVTVLLANVRMGHDEEGRFRADDVARLIAASGADVVVLNEVDRGWATTGSHDVGAVLARATGMTLVFAPAADEVWGNAVLTRLPVREVEVERLPRGSDAMARSVVVVVLGLDDGRDLAVVGTHLSHVDRRGDTRLPQAQAVAAAAARMRERGIPTVVAGDLNAEPAQPELLAFADLVASALPPGRPTYPAARPRVQIDHVLVSDDLEVRAAEVLPDRLSDHRFVRVVLGLPTPDAGADPAEPDAAAG